MLDVGLGYAWEGEPEVCLVQGGTPKARTEHGSRWEGALEVTWIPAGKVLGLCHA